MKEVTEQDLRELSQIGAGASGCVSIYLPTARRHPENQQDPIRFRNLVRSVIEQMGLSDLFDSEEATTIESQLESLAKDADFWNHRTDGLAWLYGGGNSHVLEFQRSVPELAIVSNSLHLKPLIRIVQSADRYHVLAITRHSAKLYAGTRDKLDEIHLEEIPATIQEALGDEFTDKHLTVASYGGSESAMHHGHGSKDAEEDKDRDRYFQAVATAVEKHWSNPGQLPLVLVALDQHHAHYHRISQDRFLLDQGVSKDPGSMSIDEIRDATWEVMRGYFDQQLASDIERLADASAQNKGSSVVSDLTREANNGRVELLILEEDAQLPGKVDWETGAVTDAETNGVGEEDVLDDLAEMVLSRGGKVRIVRPGSLGNASKIGGIFRY